MRHGTRRQVEGEPAGLYDPRWEHDACGIGAAINISGDRDHAIVEHGKQILLNLMHRGAAGADESSGDGAGILLQIPHEFFLGECERLGHSLPGRGQYGVAMVFFPMDAELRHRCEQLMIEGIKQEGLRIVGRREVPVNHESMGDIAREGEPFIRQIFIAGDALAEDVLERRLYVARKSIERAARAALGERHEEFYIPSMSCKTIVYKGMFLAPQLFGYYHDLSDERIATAFAIVHQRFSTNTFPSWRLAQPFRMIAHNGEINTLRGNANQLQAAERNMACGMLTDDISKILPVLEPGGSDSACFDNAMELLVRAGRSAPHALMMMIPEAFGPKYHISTDKRAFYEYHSAIMEPWDGPAAMVFTDGRRVGGTLDRNGLRPSRYVVTTDGLVVLASEVGVIDFPPEKVRQKGRLQPGRMFLVDTHEGRIVVDNEIKGKIARQNSYRRWLEDNRIELRGLFHPTTSSGRVPGGLTQRLRAFAYSREDLAMVIGPMAVNGQEPIGSMGTDTPLAVLSERPKLLFGYFKQLFAQVTNPPIDPLREALVMSLMAYVGKKRNLLAETPEHCRQVKLPHPILTNEDLHRLRAARSEHLKVAEISSLFDAEPGDPAALRQGLEELVAAGEKAITEGASLLVVSDRAMAPDKVPIPALLATAALHHGLLERGVRGEAGIVLESGEPREVMHFCLLCGYGANAINPYMAFEVIHKLQRDGELPADVELDQLDEQYVTAVKKGILKTMSKMGISTLRSYHAAQQFEAVGINRDLIDHYFPGTAARIGGIGLEAIAQEALARHRDAMRDPDPGTLELVHEGEYHFRADGEKHLWNPSTVTRLQQAVVNDSQQAYDDYAREINEQSRANYTLRGLFDFVPSEPVPLEEVEPVEEIVRRFYSGAMSHGSISKEAHEMLAVAMNRLGGMANTGEGGEHPSRYEPLPEGDSANCGIKQVASGRFGVTINYLAHATMLQIKMAQGAKPGEGGQLPGHKVTEEIDEMRHSTLGV
ncbi:MAG: glutamate synthase central domain-containing protein, partial [Planctomycetota bacterium]